MGKINTFNTKVYQHSNKLTSNEEVIAHFIIHHPEEVTRMKIEQLEEKLYVSKSSIVRFCKKLGYDGFMELKNSLKSELIEGADESIDRNFYSIEQLILDYRTLLNRFVKFIDEKAINQLINQLKGREHIYIFGLGHSAIIAQEFALRLKRLGIRAESVTSEQEMKMILGTMDSEDLLIVLTQYCKNFNTINIISLAKQFNISTFLISSYSNPNVVKIVTNILILPNAIYLKTGNTISPMFVFIILIDVVVSGMIQENEVYKENHKKTFEFLEGN